MLSIVGCVFNVIVTLVLRSWKYTGRMVIGLSIMDFLACFSMVVQPIPIESEFLCRILSFTRCFGFGGSFAWICCFAHSLMIILKADGEVNVIDAYLNRYALIALISGLFNGVLAFVSQYKAIDESGYCTHAASKSGVMINLLIDTIPSWVTIFYCIFVYVYVAKKLKQLSSQSHSELLFYPLILIICTIPKSTRELYILFTGETVEVGLYIAASAFFLSQGLWNGLAYGLTRSILEGCKKDPSSVRSSFQEGEMVTDMSLNSMSTNRF